MNKRDEIALAALPGVASAYGPANRDGWAYEVAAAVYAIAGEMIDRKERHAAAELKARKRELAGDAAPAPQSDAPAASVKWPDRLTGSTVWEDGHNAAIAACIAAHAAALSDAPPATKDDGGAAHLDAAIQQVRLDRARFLSVVGASPGG